MINAINWLTNVPGIYEGYCVHNGASKTCLLAYYSAFNSRLIKSSTFSFHSSDQSRWSA